MEQPSSFGELQIGSESVKSRELGRQRGEHGEMSGWEK